MDEKTRRSLAEHQVRAIRRWLERPEAKAIVVEVVEGLARAADARRGSEVLDPDAVERAIRSAFGEDVRRALVAPLASALVRQATTRISARPERLADVLGGPSRDAILTLVGRGDVLDPDLVRAALVDPAVESIMRDVLLDALRQFNDRVNPFFADWGLPSLVATVPLGKRALEKALDQVRKEFDRRLEPEMVRFLERFANRSLERLACSLVEGAGEPEMVALRRHLAQVVLDASLQRLTWPPDDPRGALVVAAAVEAVDGVLAHPAVATDVVAAWKEMWDEVGERPLGEVRVALGIELPPVRDVVEAAWPAAVVALSEEVFTEPLATLLAGAAEGWSADP